MADYTVKTEFTADASGFTKATEKVQQSLNKLKDGIGNASNKLGDSTKNMRTNLSGWGLDFDKLYNKSNSFFSGFGIDMDKMAGKLGTTGSQLALFTVAIMGAVKALELLHKSALEFDKVNETLAKGTGATGRQLKELNQDLNAVLMSGNVNQWTSDISQAMADLNTKLGLTDEKLQFMTESVSHFADVTNTSVTEAVKSVTDITNKYNLTNGQALTLMDQLTVASQNSGASTTKLADALKDGKAQFEQFGLSITDSLSMLATFEKAGVESSTVTMGLKTALAKFTSSGIDASEGLKTLIDEIQSGENETQALSDACSYFGTRAGAEMYNAIKNNSAGIVEMTEALNNATGAVDRTDKASETLSDIWNEMKNTSKGTFGGLLSGFNELEKALLSIVADIQSRLAPVLEPVMSTIGAVFGSIATIFKSLKENIDLIIDEWTGGQNSIVSVIANIFNNIQDILTQFANTFSGIMTIISGLLTGDFTRAWLGIKLTVMSVVNAVADLMSIMVNHVIIGVNEIIEKLNWLREKLGKDKWDLIPQVDIANATGLTEAIEKVQKEIDKNTEAHKNKRAKIIESESITIKTIAVDTAETVETTSEEVTNTISSDIKDLGKQPKTFAQAWSDAIDDIKFNADDWSDVVSAIQSQLNTLTTSFSQDLGNALVGAGSGFESFGATALKALSEVLSALSAQLSALAVAKAMTHSYGESAMAMAGAVGAGVASGMASGVANSLGKSDKNSMANTVERLSGAIKELTEAVLKLNNTSVDKFANSFKYLASAEYADGIKKSKEEIKTLTSTVDSAYKDYQSKLKEVEEHSGFWDNVGYAFGVGNAEQTKRENNARDSKAYYDKVTDDLNNAKKALEELENALQTSRDELNASINTQLEETSNTLDAYKELFNNSSIMYGEYTQNIKKALKEMKINEALTSVYQELITAGQTMSNKILEGITNGDNQNDINKSLKDYFKNTYIKKYMLENMSGLFDSLGDKINSYINGGVMAGIDTQVTQAVDSIKKQYNSLENILDKIFHTEDEVSEVVNEVTTATQTLANDITDALTNAFTDGLNGGDFWSAIKDSLKNMIIQMAVFTDEFKDKLAEIGHKLADGIKNGFTEGGLLDIKVELADMFAGAQSVANSATSVLDSVMPTINNGSGTTNTNTSAVTNINYTFNSPTELNPAEMIAKIRQTNLEMSASGII